MINPEFKGGQESEQFRLKKDKPKSEPITSEQSEQTSGEIGESKVNPVDYFKDELNLLGKNYTEAFGPGMTIEKWDANAKEHAEKRKSLQEIVRGLQDNNPEAKEKAEGYLHEQMAQKEKELAPLAVEEGNLNDDINNMKQAELSGEKDFGYLKFHAKNQELDDLYKKLNKEKQLAEPNKFRLREIKDDISGTEYIRDNTEFGGVARGLRNIQNLIEKINSNRNKLDTLIRKLQE